MKNYQNINSAVIDRWVEEGWEWGKPITKEIYQAALNGDWDVVLTPTVKVPKNWFPDVKGLKILGLASGGGQQMPIFKALGADCTVLDYSTKQLESERIIAQREGYHINIVHADMTKPLPFNDESFDLIFHPVSNCYIKDVKSVFKECYRVLKKGGLLLSGLDNSINYIVDEQETMIIQKLPFNPLEDEALYQKCLDNDWGIQFSHTLEEQIGGQLQAGFRLLDLYEDTNGQGRLHELNIKCFFATKSIKE
ncbi:class I SAM-dependent methyltransferase [Liberiplasma polymorphum]|uniref:class I SAM-dependent methyltransferase n=1 Tax=Liberiplasma polymorphum TaxID=3374570 RepID=UPI003773448B